MSVAETFSERMAREPQAAVHPTDELEPWELHVWRDFVRLRWAVYGASRRDWRAVHPPRSAAHPWAPPGPLREVTVE